MTGSMTEFANHSNTESLNPRVSNEVSSALRNHFRRFSTRHRVRDQRKIPQRGKQSSPSVMPRLTIATVGCVTGAFFGGTLWQDKALAAESRRMFMWYDHENVMDRLHNEFRRRFGRNFSSHDVLYCTMAVCASVFAAWRNPRLLNVMKSNFIASLSSSNPVRSMILSGYSHTAAPHLLLNCLAMFFIGSMVAGTMRKEELTFFIFASGVTSGYATLLLNAVLRDLTRMSLGASGILYAFAGHVFTAFPHAGFSVFPISLVYPHSIEGRNILIGLLVFDLIGLIFFRHKSLLDHAGHLGGLLFGVCYASYGRQLWLNQVFRWKDSKQSV